MEEKLALVKSQSKFDIKTMYIVADFSKMYKIQEYEDIIAAKLRDIDIGLLFLNAGIGGFVPFENQENSSIEEIVNVNAIHPIYLSKVLLNQLLKRTKRSAIVVTSSGLGSVPIPGTIIYSASKSFSSFLA